MITSFAAGLLTAAAEPQAASDPVRGAIRQPSSFAVIDSLPAPKAFQQLLRCTLLQDGMDDRIAVAEVVVHPGEPVAVMHRQIAAALDIDEQTV